MRIHREYDLICLGGGIGGITAALRAHDLGLSALVLEKSDQLGGTAAYSSGQQWVAGSYLAADAGLSDSWEEGFRFLDWLADGSADPNLLRKFCRMAPEVYEFMGKDADVRWCLFDVPDTGWPDAPGSKERGRSTELEPFDGRRLPEQWRDIVRHSPHSRYSNTEMYFEMGGLPNRHTWDPAVTAERTSLDVRCQGSALAAYMVMAVHDRGIPMLTNVSVREVTIDDGRISGVVAVLDGSERRITATRGVVVATGGYDWNPDLMQRFDGQENFGSRAPQSITGDHFGLIESLQPALATVSRPYNLGYCEPGDISVGGRDRWQTLYTGFPHVIVVNRFGKRFKDESQVSERGRNELLTAVDGDGQLINKPCFAVLDSQYRSKYQIGVVRPGEPLPSNFVEAATLGELAARLGIDGQELERTVAKFNEHAQSGSDPDLGRGTTRSVQIRFGDPWMTPNPNLGTVEEAPFFGIELTPVGVALTQTGFQTDEYARVLDTRGEAIAGLYAVGNSAAYLDVGRNYHGGIANSRGMTWGYIAAGHAAGL